MLYMHKIIEWEIFKTCMIFSEDNSEIIIGFRYFHKNKYEIMFLIWLAFKNDNAFNWSKTFVEDIYLK